MFVIFNLYKFKKTKTMKEVQDFSANACEVCPDENTMTCTIWVDTDGWDNTYQAYKDIEYFAEGSNDPMGEEIEEELYEMGLELIYPGEISDDGDVIDFKMRRVE
jgi:hypothetical protein